ncbi:MAG: quinolinate synthase NadA [Chloroflexota bacterium]
MTTAPLPMLDAAAPRTDAEARERLARIADLSAEVRDLAGRRNAVILAHHYQVPEVQDVADFVGDSLGLARRAAATDADVIAFCGVHFMAETASITPARSGRCSSRTSRRAARSPTRSPETNCGPGRRAIQAPWSSRMSTPPRR